MTSAMSEESSNLPIRQGPSGGEAQVADFTMLVHVPGRPAAVRVYTGHEPEEAKRYACESRGVVVPLPLSRNTPSETDRSPI